MTYEQQQIARAIHDYDRRESLGEIPSWSKLKKADRDRYLGRADAALETVVELMSL
jgi:hypothetical protein